MSMVLDTQSSIPRSTTSYFVFFVLVFPERSAFLNGLIYCQKCRVAAVTLVDLVTSCVSFPLQISGTWSPNFVIGLANGPLGLEGVSISIEAMLWPFKMTTRNYLHLSITTREHLDVV